MDRRKLLAGLVAVPLVIKSTLSGAAKRKRRLFAAGYTTDNSFKRHENCFGYFIPDDNSFERGREVIVSYRRVINDNTQNKDGDGYISKEKAAKDRMLRRLYKNWRDFLRVEKEPRLITEFFTEHEDMRLVYAELSALLEEISAKMKQGKIT